MKAKKSLGQNFLKSKAVTKRMVGTANIGSSDFVMEIGPGKGVLTDILLETSAKVVAIEKDDNLFTLLQEKFKEQIQSEQLKIIHDDVLEIDLDEISEKNYKIVANIPYNITGALFKKIFSSKILPQQVVMMVQKEVAQRIIARDGKESIISIATKAYGDPKIVMKVKKELFSPKPKVDSAVISIENISRDRFKNLSEEKFFEVLRVGFAHKRKKLSSNLKIKFGGKVKEALKKTNVDENQRPEEITIDQWVILSKFL